MKYFKFKPLILATLSFVVLSVLLLMVSMNYVDDLEKANLEEFKQYYLDQKKQELASYTKLAFSSFENIYNDSSLLNDEEAKERVKDIVRNLNFKDEDGYFYIIDYKGFKLVDPQSLELENRNVWDVKDRNGKYLTRELVDNARYGDGFTTYLSYNSSIDDQNQKKLTGKINYTQVLSRWEWVYGAELYIDDIEDNLVNLNNRMNIYKLYITIFTILMIFFLFLIVVFINRSKLNEGGVADFQFKNIPHRRFQIQEEKNESIILTVKNHIKPSVLTVHEKIDSLIQSGDGFSGKLHEVNNCVADILININKLFTDLGVDVYDKKLDATANAILDRFEKKYGFEIDRYMKMSRESLPFYIKKIVLDALEESLNNVVCHANTKIVKVRLSVRADDLQLEITDKGDGFDIKSLKQINGVGFFNLRRSLDEVHGQLHIYSQQSVGTILKVRIPLFDV